MKVKVVYLVLIVAVLLLCYSRREHATGSGGGQVRRSGTSSGLTRQRAPMGPKTWWAMMYPFLPRWPLSAPYDTSGCPYAEPVPSTVESETRYNTPAWAL